MELTKEMATAVAELIESNYGELIEIIEQAKRVAQNRKTTSEDIGHRSWRKETAEVVADILWRLSQMK